MRGGIYGIGVDVDQCLSTLEPAECIVTSAEKNLTKAVHGAAIIACRRWQRQAVGATSSRHPDTDGIGLAPFYDFAALIITDAIKIDAAIAAEGTASVDVDPCKPSGLCTRGKEDKGT